MMSARELLKLACSGQIYVLKIVRDADGAYVLKRMRALMYPSYEKIASAEMERELQFDIDLYRNGMSVLLVSEKLSVSDFDNMKKAGFRVFRKSERMCPAVEEYAESTRRWRTLRKFGSIQARDGFLSELLYEKCNVCVN